MRDEQTSSGTPLEQSQDVSRSANAHSSSLSTTFPEPYQNWTYHEHGRRSSSTISLDHDDLEKDLAEDRISTVHQDQHAQEIPEHPSLYRVTSSGVAAPYVTPSFGYFRGETLSRTTSRRPSVCTQKGLEKLHTVSRVSTDAQGFTYPEGGLQAWLCVFGSFCGMVAALGIMNTLGTIQTYISEYQLHGSSESTIGWIFGLYTFLAFFCGIQVGPIFDAKGPRWLVAPGSILILLTWFLLGFCTQYWHFIVVFSICGGIGTSLVFTPAITAIGHWFFRRRGYCTGIAAVGGSLGGVIYPLILQALFPKIGFAWATRVIGFISIVMVIFANLFIRARLPPRKATKESILPDLKIFRDPVYSLTTMGIFFVEWALFIPLTYLTSYAISKGVDANLSYQIIAIFNAGSCLGRWLPGLIADKFGCFNTIIITTTVCTITTFAMWLPAGSSVGLIIAYAVIFGFASGSGISLTPVCVSRLCKVENYGRYYATCYTMVSFACLTGIPIAGTLVSAANGSYWTVIVFTGCSYGAALACFVAARCLGAGLTLRKVF